jgi:hypothetical protein
MIFRFLILAYSIGVLLGALSIVEWLGVRLLRLYLAGRFTWLELRLALLVRMVRRIAR